MFGNEVGFSISHCENSWQKKRELERAGFNIHHYNQRFILSSVMRKENKGNAGK